jgi:PAS domain S-box-containing protein
MPVATPPRSAQRGWLVAAAVALLGLIAVSGGSAWGYVSALRWVDHTLEVRHHAYEWLTSLLDADIAARGIVAGRPRAPGDSYEEELAEERADAERMNALVLDNPAQARNVQAANRDAQALVGRLSDLVSLVAAGRRDQATAQVAAGEITFELDAFRHDVQAIRDEEDRLLLERRSQVAARGWLTSIGVMLLATMSSLLLFGAWRSERGHQTAVARLAAQLRDRLETLSDLAAALADARSRAQVAEVVVDRGMRAAGADTCTLYELDENGAALELLGHRGVAPELIDKLRRVTATSGNPSTFAAMKARDEVWAESDAAYAAIHPSLASMKERRARAFWSVPLVAEDRTVGLLGVGFYQPRRFTEEERAFVRTLANQCAQALLRASRMEHEDEARQWLSTTLRSIGDAVIATDADGRVTFMNAVAEELTGWTQDDARGRMLAEVFPIFSEQTRSAVESPVAKVLREGAVVGLANHTVLRSKRGVEIPIDDSGAPIRNESGRIVGVVLVFRDATVEKRERVRSAFLAKSGEALASSVDYEKTLATVAQLAVPTIADWCAVDLVEADGGLRRQVAIAHVDASKVLAARELGERYPADPNAATGVPNVIRTGKSELYAEISPAFVERAAVDAEHLRLLRDLRLESAMVVALRARGRTFGAITYVYADSGRRYSVDDLAFAEDFARRAAMAIENALAIREADEARAKERWLRGEAELANRSKDEFLATVSHELRTPLNAILGWAVTLRGRKPPESIDRGLTIIERNARTQAKLIEDILDVSRIVSGKLVLNLGPTKVADAVSAAVETVTPAAEAKEIAIEIENADPSLVITADAERVQQIVWNLLSNAVKFTPKGGRVKIATDRRGSDMRIRVTDTGEGIRASVLPLIFERFQQADASTTRRHGGLGLGLAIVKQLVSAHGGSVYAESAGLGLGASFVVLLPARSVVPAMGRASRVTPTAEARPANSEGPRLDGLRLLVVDDEPDARDVVSEALRERGAEVHVAGSATEALEKLGAVRPDVIVSDIGMPETDGYSLMRSIRARPPEAGGRTPAVALTAYARAEDAQRAFVAGYQSHVAKPIEPAQLATVVANLGGVTMDEG